MNELGVEYNLWLDELDVLNKEARMDDCKLRGYRIQEELKCCQTCGNHDIAVDTEGTEYPLCTIWGDPVDSIGICDDFEW